MRNPQTGGKTTTGDVMTNADEPLKRAEVNMVTQAIRRGWNIPPKVLENLPVKLAQLLETYESMGDTEMLARTQKLLKDMHADNMKDLQHLERLEQSDRHHRDKMADDKPKEIRVRLIEGDDDD
jgi:hypothetical protein